MTEFNLSEKLDESHSSSALILYLPSVKEFIKRRNKEELDFIKRLEVEFGFQAITKNNNLRFYINNRREHIKRNKLAGDKLTSYKDDKTNQKEVKKDG